MMTGHIKLEPPFYLAEVVDQFLRPVQPVGAAGELPLAALDEPVVCEALNRALKLSIERAS